VNLDRIGLPLLKYYLESGLILLSIIIIVDGRWEDTWAILFYSGFGC
jgi:hypothetical protein